MGETEASILFVQLAFQFIQFACLLYVMMVPAQPKICGKYVKCFMYITWFVTMIYFIIVPICAIIHWLVYVKTAVSDENVIRAWLFCYPLMCLVTIGFYFFIVNVLISSMKMALFYLEKDPLPYRDVSNIINLKANVESENGEKDEEEKTCL